MLAALPILVGYYVVMVAGRAYAIAGQGGVLPPSVAAWLPNAIVILAAVAISAHGAARQATE